MSEAEKRLHRCCFSGHRPEKLDQDESEVTAWLDTQISRAIDEGCTTFITGMGMGVEIWAGELVIRRRAENPCLHLIAAVPWPGFAARWSDEWKQRYAALLAQADLTVNVCERYVQDVFRKRNEWMLDHSVRLIAYYNGEDGGTAQAIHAAENRQVQVICGGMRQAPADYVAYDLETTGLSPLANRIL